MLCPTRHLVRHVLHLLRDLFEILLLAVCSVAIRLVHANALLFLSLEIDHFRMLSRLSLDITAIFATGYTQYFVRVSGVVSIFICRQSAKCQRKWSILTRAAVFPHETSVICSVVRFIIIDTVC